MDRFTFACIQLSVRSGDEESNLERAVSLLDRACGEGAGMAALPEMFTTAFDYPYMTRIAKPIPNRIIDTLAERAARNRCVVIAGSIPEARGGRVYNTAAVILPDGSMAGVYRKAHLFPLMEEDAFLTPGDGIGVFDTPLGRIGVMICYDVRFPELARRLALEGARFIVMPAQFPKPRLEHWETLTRARAIENQVFFAAVNRTGAFGSSSFFGNSVVYDPWGETLCRLGEEEGVGFCEIDLPLVDAVREKLPCFPMRRPDLY